MQDLNKYKIFFELDFVELLLAHPKPREMVDGLILLQQNRLFSDTNVQMIIQHRSSEELTEALIKLKESEILTSENFRAVVVSKWPPLQLANGLSYLDQAGILTISNRIFLSNSSCRPDFLAYIFIRLSQAQMLTEKNQEIVMLTEALFHSEVLDTFWVQFPLRLLSENWTNIIKLASNQNGVARLIQFTRETLATLPEPEPAPNELNDAQSVHHSSVNLSVSESATKLKNRYGNNINFEQVFSQMQNTVMNLEDSVKNRILKRAIKRLLDPSYSFSAFGMKVQELMAYCWLGIHDNTNRVGTLEDSLTQFFQGLVEIQRGYNLNELGQDQSGLDSPICPEGTFCKLIEKLQGIHPDANIIFITKTAMALKLHSLIIDMLIITLKDNLALGEKFLWDDVNIVEQLWDVIKPRIIDELEEYRGLFRNDAEFLENIEVARDLELNHQDKDKIVASIQTHFSLVQQSLFANSVVSETRSLELSSQLPRP